MPRKTYLEKAVFKPETPPLQRTVEGEFPGISQTRIEPGPAAIAPTAVAPALRTKRVLPEEEVQKLEAMMPAEKGMTPPPQGNSPIIYERPFPMVKETGLDIQTQQELDDYNRLLDAEYEAKKPQRQSLKPIPLGMVFFGLAVDSLRAKPDFLNMLLFDRPQIQRQLDTNYNQQMAQWQKQEPVLSIRKEIQRKEAERSFDANRNTKYTQLREQFMRIQSELATLKALRPLNPYDAVRKRERESFLNWQLGNTVKQGQQIGVDVSIDYGAERKPEFTLQPGEVISGGGVETDADALLNAIATPEEKRQYQQYEQSLAGQSPPE